MDLRQLNAVVAVAEYGSFSAAADALHTVQSNISTHVARLVPAMAEQHPKVHMVIVEATSTSLEPQLADRLDLAVVNLPVPGDDLIWRPLFDEDLLLVVPADHPLADRGEVDITDTDGIELLMP